MRITVICILSLAIGSTALAKTELELKREMHLKVSREYSRCGAYYEISASVLKELESAGVQEALKRKKNALDAAFSMAAEHEGAKNAKRISGENYAEAINQMHYLAKNDTNRFKAQLDSYRTKCRNAVDDRSAFIDAALSDYRKKEPAKPSISSPITLSAADILQRARPTTSVRDPEKCSKPAELVRVSLNEMLLDKDRICATHSAGVCDGEQNWLSTSEYLENLYPTGTIHDHSRKSSMAFKNGEMQQDNEIVACVTVP